MSENTTWYARHLICGFVSQQDRLTPLSVGILLLILHRHLEMQLRMMQADTYIEADTNMHWRAQEVFILSYDAKLSGEQDEKFR